MKNKPCKSATLTIRVTPNDKKIIEQYAHYFGMSVSDYLASKGTRCLSRMTRSRKNKVNTALVIASHNIDTLRTDLLNLQEETVNPKIIASRLTNIFKEANELWHVEK